MFVIQSCFPYHKWLKIKINDHGRYKKEERSCVLPLAHLANENCKNRLKTCITLLWHGFIDQPTYQGWQVHQFEVDMDWIPWSIAYCLHQGGHRAENGWPWFLSIAQKVKDEYLHTGQIVLIEKWLLLGSLQCRCRGGLAAVRLAAEELVVLFGQW